MNDPEAEAREIVERLPVLTVPCSHCPKVSQHVVSDMARAANRAIDVIATALRAAREAEFVSGAEEGYENGYAAGRWDGMRTANACTEGTHTPETCTCPYARGYAAGTKAARPAAPPEEARVSRLRDIASADDAVRADAHPDDAAVERVIEKWYPLIAGRVIALEKAGETVAHATWLECARDFAALRRGAQ